MRAIVVKGPGDIGMIDVEKPKAGPGDILIKVSYSGICGTDHAILDGNISFVKDGLIRYPVRIGHEWSGIIEETGEAVKDLKKGDRVVADNAVSCEKCEACIKGDFKKCKDLRSVGTVNCWDGSFAEYMLMPERHVYKLPDNISLEEAALIEPATIALYGLKKSGVDKDGSLLVIGTGPIGLAAVALAKNMGISKVLLSGRKQFKMDIGKKLGADAVVNITKEDLSEFVKKNTAHIGVDAVLETSGNIEAVNSAVGIIRPKGSMTLVGFYERTLDGFPIDQMVLNEIQLRGSTCELGLCADIIEKMSLQGLDLKPLITHRIAFKDAVEAIKTATYKNDTKIKMMVKMGD